MKALVSLAAGIVLALGVIAPASAESLYLPEDATLPIGAATNQAGVEMKMCNSSHSITAMEVGAGDYVNRILFHCDDVLGGGYTGSQQYDGGVGSGDSTSYDVLSCGPHQFAVGVRGKVSSFNHRVTGFQLLCGTGRGAATATAFSGRDRPHDGETLIGAAFSCGPGKVATGLYAFEPKTERTVYGFTFFCKDIRLLGGWSANQAGDFIGNWTVTVSDGSFPMTLYTNAGQLVGVYDQTGRNGIIMNVTATSTDISFNLQTTGTIKGSGTGKFHLVDKTHLSGSWTFGAAQGTWTAVKGSGLGGG